MKRLKIISLTLIFTICAAVLSGCTNQMVDGGRDSVYIAAPVAGFGLAPVIPNVELISETAVLKSGKIESRKRDYEAELVYKVKTPANAEFILPSSVTDNEIYVDGVKISSSVSDHPNAYNQILRWPEKQSVWLEPFYKDLKEQPADTYYALMKTFLPDKSNHKLNMNSEIWIYDVSGAEENFDEKKEPPAFEVIGAQNGTDVVFTNKVLTLKEIKEEDRTKFYLYTKGNENSAAMNWYGIIDGDANLTVKVGDEVISPKKIKLSEICQKVFLFSGEAQFKEYAQELTRYLGVLKPSDKAVELTPNLKKDGGNTNMHRFSIKEAGEHTITIKMSVLGVRSGWDSEMEYCVQLADSPSYMWQKAGTRTVTVDIKGKKYAYPIGDDLFEFVFKTKEPKETVKTTT